MSALNALLRAAFDGILYPFHSLPPAVGLGLVSLVVSIGMLLVYKATSNQHKLDAVKRQIHACLRDPPLQHDLPAILRAQMRSAPQLPLPALLGARAADARAARPRDAQPSSTVATRLAGPHFPRQGAAPDGWAAGAGVAGGAGPSRPAATLEAPAGLEIETPAVWIPTQRELAWRLRAKDWGDYALKLRVGEQEYSKTVQVSPDVRRRSPIRLAPGFLNELLYPAEDPLPNGSPVASISVGYTEASVSLFGWGLNWLVLFFVLSVAFAFALRGPFGVVM